ncbi:tRNA-His guanylyltransferase [Neocucurbitaria cava]|uniref:tRNA-His guanylyltransferase n=1 Tax=Neocucurbitaria cava TaxID=798079 RepID=A0A9W8Y3G7_9PLEO|nr:tRNA-His guanylyltransferase [Neocucurbitaria cava]
MSTLKAARQDFEGKENAISPAQAAGTATPRKVSPPLQTNKALPSPPMNTEEEMRTREKVMGSTPQQEWSMYSAPNTQESPRSVSDADRREGRVWLDQEMSQSDLAKPASTSTPRTKSHSRLHSAPVSSATPYYPYQGFDTQALSSVDDASNSRTANTLHHTSTAEQDIQPTPPLKDSPRSKASAKAKPPTSSSSLTSSSPRESKSRDPTTTATSPQDNNANKQPKRNKGKAAAAQGGGGGWAPPPNTHQQQKQQQQPGDEGRGPVQMSRTQRDKDRKKRSRAKVLIEHVDIIRDEFWERRPWILSGKTG